MGGFSVFNWRILIFKSDLPANSKYIGCYLSTYMNEWGDNCYPSIARICHETCLTKPTVIKYIHILQENGWLEAKKKGFDGQAWAHNQYYPNIPKEAVKEVYHVKEGGKTGDRRRLNSSSKAVKEVNTSSTVNSSENSTVTVEENSPVSMPREWMPNDLNNEWLENSGLLNGEKVKIIQDFKDFWILSETKRKNWDLSFRRNPIVIRAVNLNKNKNHDVDEYGMKI